MSSPINQPLKTREKNGEFQTPILILFTTKKKREHKAFLSTTSSNTKEELGTPLLIWSIWELQVPLMMVCWEKIHEKGEHETPLSTLFITHKGEFRAPPVMAFPIIF